MVSNENSRISILHLPYLKNGTKVLLFIDTCKHFNKKRGFQKFPNAGRGDRNRGILISPFFFGGGMGRCVVVVVVVCLWMVGVGMWVGGMHLYI